MKPVVLPFKTAKELHLEVVTYLGPGQVEQPRWQYDKIWTVFVLLIKQDVTGL